MKAVSSVQLRERCFSGRLLYLSKDAKDNIRLWGMEFNELYTNMKKRVWKLTNREWRIIKRQLKAVDQVSFKNLNKHLSEICDKLNALKLEFNYGI